MTQPLLAIRDSVRHREFLLLSLGAAVWALQTPLQHYIELSRFQHYAIGIFCIAAGFLLQTALSWRYYSLSGRLAMISSTLYLTAFGLVCFHNPWLDPNFDLQTQYQETTRPMFGGGFLVAGFICSFFWATWMNEGNKAKKKAREAQLQLQMQMQPHTESHVQPQPESATETQ
jgi:hypothetical protein